MNEEQLARKFHEIYERLSPKFRYETRKETREFNPASNNGRLMIAVCAEILKEMVPFSELNKCQNLAAERWNQLHPNGLKKSISRARAVQKKCQRGVRADTDSSFTKTRTISSPMLRDDWTPNLASRTAMRR